MSIALQCDFLTMNVGATWAMDPTRDAHTNLPRRTNTHAGEADANIIVYLVPRYLGFQL